MFVPGNFIKKFKLIGPAGYSRDRSPVWYVYNTQLEIKQELTQAYLRKVARNNKTKNKESKAFSRIVNHYKARAKQNHREFALTLSEFMTLIKGNCHYCGIPPGSIRKVGKSSIIKNGIDRKDSSGGYTIDNCVSCCTSCNVKKQIKDYNEFKNKR